MFTNYFYNIILISQKYNVILYLSRFFFIKILYFQRITIKTISKLKKIK